MLATYLDNVPRLTAKQAHSLSLQVEPLFFQREEDFVYLAIYEAVLSKRFGAKVPFRISNELANKLTKEGYNVTRKKEDLLENMNLYPSMSPESLLYRWHDVTYITF